jgi:methyl-accepting chemotaxis protein
MNKSIALWITQGVAMIGSSKLATKFNLLLSLMFVVAIALSGFALSKALERKVETEVNYRSQILVEMVNAIRSYTSKHVNPLLMPKVEAESTFTPEVIPSFAAREVFETLRKNPEYKNLFYKDATLNPTNLRDKVDEFETSLIERFQKDPGLQSLSGFRNVFGEEMFYSARPLAIKDASCLKCHSTPEAAPKSHLATYGSENGFGWKLNEVLGTQVVYVPANQLVESAHQTFVFFIGVFIAIFALVILLINYLVQRNMIQPIKPLAQLAQKMSADTLNADEAAEFEQKSLKTIAKRQDEIGQLGRVFQRMMHEVYAREQSLKQQIQTLYIQIDETKRTRQLAELEDSESFQKLQQEAADMRNKWKTGNQ